MKTLIVICSSLILLSAGLGLTTTCIPAAVNTWWFNKTHKEILRDDAAATSNPIGKAIHNSLHFIVIGQWGNYLRY